MDYPFQWVSMSKDDEEMRQKLFPHDFSLMTKSVISNVRGTTFFSPLILCIKKLELYLICNSGGNPIKALY